MLMLGMKAGRSSQSRAKTESRSSWGSFESVAWSRSALRVASISQSRIDRWFSVSVQGARSGIQWWSAAQAYPGSQSGSWCD